MEDIFYFYYFYLASVVYCFTFYIDLAVVSTCFDFN